MTTNTKGETKTVRQRVVVVHLSSPLPVEGIKRMLEFLPDTVVTSVRVVAGNDVTTGAPGTSYGLLDGQG